MAAVASAVIALFPFREANSGIIIFSSIGMASEVPRWVIYDTIVDLIKKEGIPSYVAAWERDLVPFHELPRKGNDATFLAALSERIVKRYHFHSRLLYDNADPVGMRARAPTWGKKPPRIRTRMVKGTRVGILSFYACSFRYDRTADRAILDEQAHSVASAVRQWYTKIDGLIIDLRNHSGGDIYPFLVGLGDILEGVTMYSWGHAPTTRKQRTWEIGGTTKIGAFTTDRLKCRFPVAVLIGPTTASAGEANAAMFYNKPNVKTFGQDTAGFLSGNVVLTVYGNIEMQFTSALVTTSDGTFHKDQLIRPNVTTKRPLQDAIAWIQSRVLSKK